MTLTADQARDWLHRWDAQQEHYIPDREDRFAVIADVVETAVTTLPADRPVTIVDLGAGPGSLSARLLDRLPGSRVVAMDADALLLGLARAAYDGLTVVERDLREAGWLDAVAAAAGGEGTVDAVVSTTALHWLTRPELAEVYRGAARLLRPGGLLVNGDHLDESEPTLAALTAHVRDRRRARQGVLEHEDWQTWWDAVAAAPELAPLAAERGPRPIEHHVDDVPTAADHRALLLEAGFAEAGTVWQYGDDRVLVGVR
ncbi:class I SAM-dependent methyltransferase [Nocardioides marinquilinus]|uniref:Class I SAM-dependent methyltransferase n=1 Tax=Nocardioides marinquilinus TaxID=1210400 RepID=A0ABP9P8J6_9ACTN